MADYTVAEVWFYDENGTHLCNGPLSRVPLVGEIVELVYPGANGEQREYTGRAKEIVSKFNFMRWPMCRIYVVLAKEHA